jgi:osmotically-inducible protein OsmY
MSTKRLLWQTALALSIATLTVSAFAESEGGNAWSPNSAPTQSISPAGQVLPEATLNSKDQAGSAIDKELNQKIRQVLGTDPTVATTVQNIELSTSGGEVTLSGEVSNKKEKEQLQAKIEDIDGVEKIDNQLQITGTLGAGLRSSGGSGSAGMELPSIP